MTWTSDSIPSQTGRTFVITGANSGIGLEAAKVLAAKEARVVLAVRNTEKGEAAARSIGASAEVRALDLADLGSIRAFAEDWTDPIDVLIDNAGVMAVPLSRTADGFELQFGTNHLGHFALTNLLLPKITERVVVVASSAHRAGSALDLSDLDWKRRHYRRWPAYGQSKLANLLFVLELERRLIEAAVRSPGDRRPSRLRGDEPAEPHRPRPDRQDLHGGQQGDRPGRRRRGVADVVRSHSRYPGRQLRRTGRPIGESRSADPGGPVSAGQ